MELKPCPKCHKVDTAIKHGAKVPKLIRWLFPIGYSCSWCGYYSRSVKAWNRSALK